MPHRTASGLGWPEVTPIPRGALAHLGWPSDAVAGPVSRETTPVSFPVGEGSSAAGDSGSDLAPTTDLASSWPGADDPIGPVAGDPLGPAAGDDGLAIDAVGPPVPAREPSREPSPEPLSEPSREPEPSRALAPPGVEIVAPAAAWDDAGVAGNGAAGLAPGAPEPEDAGGALAPPAEGRAGEEPPPAAPTYDGPAAPRDYTQPATRAERRTAPTLPKPTATRIITVANQKGGVGKTTTAVNLAAALAQSGLQVLVIDTDPQGNASTALGIDHRQGVPSVYEVLIEEVPLADVVQECPDIPGLFCAPATIDLAGAEVELISFVARETRLQRAVTAYLDGVGANAPDYVLVDCPPSLGLLTLNAFVAGREVLIPIQCEYYALEGLSMLLKNIEMIKRHLNPTLHLSSILLTMFDGRTRLSSQVADEVRTHFPELVFKTRVPRSVRISEAPSHGLTVMTYDPTSSGALSYAEAAAELAITGGTP